MPMTPWIPAGITSGGIPLPEPAPGPANVPPGPSGPLWLQKFAGGFDKFANGLSGYSPSPYLSDAENKALQQRQRAATFAQLAASSGPTVAGTTGPLQAFGQATGAGLQAGQQGVEAAIKARMAQAQIQALNNKQQASPFGDIQPGKYTPESVLAFQQSAAGGHPDYSVLRANPAGETGVPGSLQELSAINADRERRGEPPMKPEEYLAQRRGSSADSQLYAQYSESARLRGETPMPMDTFLTQFKGGVSNAEEGAKENQKRYASMISEGYKAADALPIVNRGLELLGSVSTGGIDAAKLKATNLFGVTGADEAELSANLGKAVLAQLRTTFGAQFTENEGRRLQEIEAGFGKSTEGNKRLLDQAKKLVERVARRGIDAAKRTNNAFDADEIDRAMQFSLSPGADNSQSGGPSLPHGVTEDDITETMRANKLTREQVLQRLNAR